MAASIIAFRLTTPAPIFGILRACIYFEFTFAIVSLLIEPSIKKKTLHQTRQSGDDGL
jgi:hypothetical protein